MESVRNLFFATFCKWKVSDFESLRYCLDRKMSKLEGVRTGKCQKLLCLESVRNCLD